MATKIYICANSHTYEPVEITNITTSTLGIIITIVIIIHASINLPKQNKMHNTIKCLFWLCASLAIITLSSDIIATVLCVELETQRPTLIISTLSLASYLSLLLVLLTTLLTRLKMTFDGSIYELSKRKQCGLVVLYLLSMLLGMAAITLFAAQKYISYRNYIPEYLDEISRAATVTGVLCGVFHIITAVWAVYIFSKNLLNVAVSSMDIDVCTDVHSVVLNQTQKKMIDSIVRYVGLFSISMVTSCISLVVLSGGKWWPDGNTRGEHVQVYMMVSGIDAVINLICCYLHYSFNKKYYDKFCGCLDCWKSYFIKRMRHNMHRQYLVNKGQSLPLKSGAVDILQNVVELHDGTDIHNANGELTNI